MFSSLLTLPKSGGTIFSLKNRNPKGGYIIWEVVLYLEGGSCSPNEVGGLEGSQIQFFLSRSRTVRFCESCGAAVAKRAAPDAPPPPQAANIRPTLKIEVLPPCLLRVPDERARKFLGVFSPLLF